MQKIFLVLMPEISLKALATAPQQGANQPGEGGVAGQAADSQAVRAGGGESIHQLTSMGSFLVHQGLCQTPRHMRRDPLPWFLPESS